MPRVQPSSFVTGLLALLLAWVCLPSSARAEGREVVVPEAQKFAPGTIVIHSRERALYFILGDGHAIRYPVAVPKNGKGWSGTAHVDGKYEQPAWSPPADVKHDHPELPDVIPGGAPNNPMGAAALTLDRDEYAIHGTTQKMRASIGTAASYGCIRMLNEDVLDLYSRVEVGALVIML